MDILGVLAELVEEFGFEVRKERRRKTITFKPKNTLSRHTIDNYRMVIDGSNVYISRLFIKVRGKDDFYLMPDNKILLSVDLYDPRSLRAIRDWLESL